MSIPRNFHPVSPLRALININFLCETVKSFYFIFKFHNFYNFHRFHNFAELPNIFKHFRKTKNSSTISSEHRRNRRTRKKSLKRKKTLLSTKNVLRTALGCIKGSKALYIYSWIHKFNTVEANRFNLSRVQLDISKDGTLERIIRLMKVLSASNCRFEWIH